MAAATSTAMEEIMLKRDCDGIEWSAVKRLYQVSRFDNGRAPAVLRSAFRGSHTVCFALGPGGEIIGTARAISDGVTCATIFDVCVHPAYRRRGVGTTMMRALMDDLRGQYVLLTTSAPQFYTALGFRSERGAMVAVA